MCLRSSSLLYGFVAVSIGALSDASMLASAQADKTTSRALQGCILMQDDRYRGAYNSSIGELQTEGMRFYDAAFHINHLYARRHGYAFLYQVPTKDAAFDRHPSWMKLQMIREKLECCCQWALYMDSDSFLVMRNHALSIEGLVGQQETEDLTLLLGNMYPYSEADLRLGFDPVAVISENTPYLVASYFCAGNLLFTRTKRSYEILDYWFNVTVQMDSSAAHDHPWEQLNLNKFVFPRFSSSFWVAPGEVWNSKHGEYIRHLWHPYGDEYRTDETVKHLKEVLSHEPHENK